MSHLVLAGAGHAHLFVIRRIPEFRALGWQVTVVSESWRHGYSGMSPGVLGGRYDSQSIWVPVRDLVVALGGNFVEDAVVGLDPATRTLTLASGSTLSGDLLSLNLGSHLARPMKNVSLPVIPAKPVDRLVAFSHELERLRRLGKRPLVVVAGGGAAGVEIAGSIEGAGFPVALVSSGRILSGLPEGVRSRVMANFEQRKIRILEGLRMMDVPGETLALSDGTELSAKALILATGTRPHPLMETAGLSGPHGLGIAVDNCLHSTLYRDILAAGDVADFGWPPVEKAGVYAIRQGPVLADNLLSRIRKTAPVPYRPQRNWLQLLNLGDGTAIFRRGRFVASGAWAMRLKDVIDKRFMDWACRKP